MGKFRDISGEKFGRLTVISPCGRSNSRQVIWLCKCDCGNVTKSTVSNLMYGTMKSCGCLRKECASGLNKIHGKRHTRLYRIWLNMKTRCFNPNYKEFDRYMGRGITMCDEWKNDFQSFYEPSNCRWATKKEQANNREKRRWQKKPVTV